MVANNIVMSGIRPTGFLHLGNYFGAMRNYVKMQETHTCFFMVADLHSLTTHPDTTELKKKRKKKQHYPKEKATLSYSLIELSHNLEPQQPVPRLSN